VLSLGGPASLVAVLLAAASCPAGGFVFPGLPSLSAGRSLLQQEHDGCGSTSPRTRGATTASADVAHGRGARGRRLSSSSAPSPTLSVRGACFEPSLCFPHAARCSHVAARYHARGLAARYCIQTRAQPLLSVEYTVGQVPRSCCVGRLTCTPVFASHCTHRRTFLAKKRTLTFPRSQRVL